MQERIKIICFYCCNVGGIWSYYFTNIYFMIKLKTFIQALDMLENEVVNSDKELKDKLKNVCLSELETLKKQIELV